MRRKNTYLSIDLDYWASEGDPGMNQFVNRALALDVPTLAVSSHENLLEHVDDHGVGTLINVDYHNDLCWDTDRLDRCIIRLEEGSWVNFVRGKKRMTYKWIHPHERRDLYRGLCDLENYDFVSHPELTGWGSVRYCKKLCIPWENVAAVGIAVSGSYWADPRYIPGSLVKKYMKVLQKIRPFALDSYEEEQFMDTYDVYDNHIKEILRAGKKPCSHDRKRSSPNNFPAYLP